MDNSYTILNRQRFEDGRYAIVPIRYEDRFDIMQWRNEQIYHLRQVKPLTAEDQEAYFKGTVAGLFQQEKPAQVLFSYLENDRCIGYGGLVHINWTDRNAEISFLINTALEEQYFAEHWRRYLLLLEQAAFEEMKLHKIYTYAFDMRPRLYGAVESDGFIQEARLLEHCFFEGKYIDVVINFKIHTKC